MIAPQAMPEAPRVCPRPELVERGWHPIANDCAPQEMEYSKEYAGEGGATYHVFARDAQGELRLRLAYRVQGGAPGILSTALQPEELPEDVRASADADVAAAGGACERRAV